MIVEAVKKAIEERGVMVQLLYDWHWSAEPSNRISAKNRDAILRIVRHVIWQ